MKELLEDCIKKTEPEYYPPVEKNTVAGKAAKSKETELEEWLRSLEGIRELGKREDDLSKAGVIMLENVDGKSMVGQTSPQFLEFVLDAYRSLKYGK